jgi:DNA processing protein
MTEREATILFSTFVQIGPARIKLIRKYFGSLKDGWKANRRDYLKLGFSEKLIKAFDMHRNDIVVSSYLLRLGELGIQVVLDEDSEFPERLKQINNSPYILYVRKAKNSTLSLSDLSDISLSVIGTRKMTRYGQDVTERLVTQLVDHGMTIVSGLALGIDAMSHKTAISAGGFTIAVLANGLDKIYPSTNTPIAREMLAKDCGLLISEYPLGFPSYKENFPQRNRIVSGLSMGVLVIEGTEKSGTLLTAKSAAEQGREVFAVPGPITSDVSAAPHYLLKNGATLVTSARDILDELEINSKVKIQKAKKVLPTTPEEQKILKVLGTDGIDIDSLVRISGLSTGALLSALTMMELKGMVKNVGGVYVKI